LGLVTLAFVLTHRCCITLATDSVNAAMHSSEVHLSPLGDLLAHLLKPLFGIV
jgi:hypothetical protein